MYFGAEVRALQRREPTGLGGDMRRRASRLPRRAASAAGVVLSLMLAAPVAAAAPGQLPPPRTSCSYDSGADFTSCTTTRRAYMAGVLPHNLSGYKGTASGNHWNEYDAQLEYAANTPGCPPKDGGRIQQHVLGTIITDTGYPGRPRPGARSVTLAGPFATPDSPGEAYLSTDLRTATFVLHGLRPRTAYVLGVRCASWFAARPPAGTGGHVTATSDAQGRLTVRYSTAWLLAPAGGKLPGAIYLEGDVAGPRQFFSHDYFLTVRMTMFH
jgi:hypothetical protein